MKTLSSPNISTDIFNALKERIFRWEYAPGHRFTEEALCEEFEVSRSPVREALRMLVENGFVEKEPYRGYSVKQPDMKKIHELYDVRLALELFVVAQLAENGMPVEVLEHLNNSWQSIMNDLPKMNADFPTIDEEFHETLAQATGNQSLIQILRDIDERLHFIRLSDITNTERLQKTCEQHLKILDCIKDRTVDCAREALLLNIQDGRTNVDQAVKEAIGRAYLGKS
jgi:DNA-binding GntR family transcriptional regulator